MQTRSSAATGRSRSWSRASGRLAYATVLLFLSIAPCLAGFQGSGVRGSSVQHVNRTAHSPYYRALPVGAIPNPVYQGRRGGANREVRDSQNSRLPNPVSQIGETGRRESAPSMRNPNPPASIAAPQEPKRNAEMNLPTERSKSLDVAAASQTRSKINNKFEHHRNQITGEPGMVEQRRDRLDRARGFLVNLIDLGYAPSLVDSWC